MLLSAAAEMSFWEWTSSIVQNYWPLLLMGAGITLLISITGTIIGSAIGLIVGVVRTIPVSARDSAVKRSVLKILNFILTAYIEVFRGTPMIVQATVIFYGAAFAGFYMDTTLAGILIVSINTGAYMSEIVRGGILSVDKGQFEAAHSIGMTHIKTMLNIIMPQVIRNILPATGNEFVINIKDTSVLNVIAVTELFFQGKTVAGITFQYFPAYLIICIMYFIMTFTVTRILKAVEKRMDGSDSYTIHGSQTTPEQEFKVKGGTL
ncbi:amino acid ABC transporter permease [Acetanaerobacterium elongatum]|uniref:Amino acid ABC transporter membrane protein, PAAT family n=1 Tax=Acetanaerobacterium elongatum TaxID=258515 RepID=A0A1G9VTC9_9FIRM|nr:amino acid ABC transporter membrane protein, PAAT family [Acetanaerobacterium elongatum]